ncbi:MAG: thioredoxin family protein [Gammaproteobacteria bacterium]|nr:thioredoxin family protein [Gammaproteobacteria bacterium]
MNKPAVAGLALGIVAGLALYKAGLVLAGRTTIATATLELQQLRLAELESENLRLAEDVEFLTPRESGQQSLDSADPPYDEQADPRIELAEARQRAMQHNKILMVTFGANWCQDCRALSRNLKDAEVARYVDGAFEFVNVNVGKFNRNLELAGELGISLQRGIPVAVFYDADGTLIGTTNLGELETSRRYTSKQILKFVRDVVERSRIAAPDAL